MKNEILTPDASNSSKSRSSNSSINNSQKPLVNVDDLFLGFIDNSENPTLKNNADEWNMSLILNSNLHMAISDSMKSKKERNDSKMLLGLQMAIDQTDLIYKTFPKTRLSHKFNGADRKFTLGYVGLDMDTSFDDLSDDKKATMLGIAIKLKMMITEVFEPNTKRSINKIVKHLKFAVSLTDAFYENNKGVFLFHALNPVR